MIRWVRSMWWLERLTADANVATVLSPNESLSKESIPPASVAWRTGTSNRVCRTGPPGWESIPGLLKRFTNSGSGLNPSILRPSGI